MKLCPGHSWPSRGALAITLLGILPGFGAAADTGAVGNGNWSTAATWTNGVPGTTGNAYIGSAYPTGAAMTATVTLSQNSSAGNVYLGNGAGTMGTLDLNGFNLNATNLYLGPSGGTGLIGRTGGGTLSISALPSSNVGTLVDTNGGSFSFAPGDLVQGLTLSNNSMATTAAAGNVIRAIRVDAGNTLTLGANLSMAPQQDPSNFLDIRGTLNANGHAITTSNLFLGQSDGPFALNGRGAITAGSVSVSSRYSPMQATFGMTAADAIGYLECLGIGTALPPGASVATLGLFSNGASPPNYSTGSTSATVNITGFALVYPGCTLTLGADLILTGALDLRATLNGNGHAISAPDVYLGRSAGPFVWTGRGPITATNLYVSSSYTPSLTTFNLTPADNVTTLKLYGLTSTFPATGGVHDLYLFSNNVTPSTFTVATTAGTSNVTNSAYVDTGNTLILGADLSLSTTLDLRGTVNANGHAVAAATMSMGYNQGPAAFQNDGLVTAGVWQQGNGTMIRLHHPGDALGSLLVYSNSALTVGDAAGQMTGLTVGNPTLADLSIQAGCDLMLEVNGQASGWVFRWANPSGGNHIADLQTLINGGEITFSYLNGGSYTLTADSSYTYVNVIPVPEPSTLLLSLAAVGLLATRVRNNRKK